MKVFKRVISFILVLTLTVVGLPLTQIEVEAEKENYTQYSDLLYAYSDYLNDSEYLMKYVQDTQGVFDRVYMDFLESPDFWAMNFKESLLKAVNITEWLGIMGSALGVSDYVYENALDNANQLFAKHLLQSTSRTFTDTMGAGGDWAEKISKLHELFEYYEKWADSVNVSDAEKINESLTMLYNSQLLKCVSDSDIKSLQYFIIENESASQMISKAGNILKAGEALMVALVMEDMRIYAIDSIMRFSPQGALLDGMHRLKNQLKYGFVSYFAENFIKGELLTNIADNVVESIAAYAMGSATPYTVVKLIVEVSVFVVFDCIFQVKSLDDFTTQRIITEYAYDCSSMIFSANSVFKNYFTFEDVQAYQNLYTILRALTDASFEASREICLISNKGDLNFYQNMYAEDNIYARTMEDVKKIVDKIPVSERKRTVYTEWRIDDSAVLDFGSDILSENEFYCPDGVFSGNILLAETKKITIPENSKFKIDGDLTLSRSLHSYVEGDAELTVDGELEIVGNIYERFGCSKIKNNGLLKLHKNLGTEIESCGDIIFCGTEKQYVGDSFVAENVYVENSAGIKFNSYDTIINGEFLLNGNPLDKEGYNVRVGSQRFTYDSISDYNNIEIPIDYEITKDIKANIYIKNLKTLTVPKEAKVKIDGSLQLSRSMHFEEEDYADLIVNGELEILGEQAAQFAYSKIKNYGILKLHKSLGSKIESYGDIIFCGTEKQYIKNTFEAENVYVENSAGIRINSYDPIINGEFLLNGNPLDKEGYNIRVGSQRFTYDSISDYNDIEIPIDYEITKDIKANIYVKNLKTLTVPKESKVKIDGSLQLSRSGNFEEEDYADLIVNGELEILGEQAAQFAYSKIKNYGILKLHKSLGSKIESYGDIIFCGDEQQVVREDFEAENVYVENSAGIKFNSYDTIINGEFLLNGNPLDKEGYNVRVGSQRFTYDDISNYNTIEIPMDYVITKDITANIELSTLKSLTIPSGGDVTVKGNVHLDGSNSSNTSTLVNNGNLQLVGNITCDFGAKLVNNGIFKLNGNLSCNLEGDGEYIFDGDKEQYIKPYKSSVSNFRKITLKNKSENGVIFGKKISVTELFNHNGNNFTLYERGNGSNFVDFDGDSLNDNNDPEPTLYDGVYYYGNSFGDINTDKNINILDLVKIKKAVLNNETDSKYDINKDDGINSLDLSLLRKFIFTEYHILLKKYMN